MEARKREGSVIKTQSSGKVKKFCVILESYKLPTYKNNFDDGGFKYTQKEGFIAGTVILQVEYKDNEFDEIYRIIRLINSTTYGRYIKHRRN